MSTIPPNMPPNAPPPPPPPPPYDPRMQYRVYREQQKAAWRAQKDAWRAQSYAWKASYAGVPRVPSIVGPTVLIGIGVIALLISLGYIPAHDFWTWYAHWWPLVLIGAGLALLGEWAIDTRSQRPVRRKGGFVGLIILLAFLGFVATGWVHVIGPWHDNWDNDFNGGDFSSLFDGHSGIEHRNQQLVAKNPLPANSTIEIQVPRGDVSVSTSDDNLFTVNAQTVVYGGTDEEAKPHFKELLPNVTITGNSVLVRSDDNKRGRVDLTITVPKNAKLSINAGHGDVTVADTTGGLNATLQHGDLHVNSLGGPLEIHAAPKGEFTAHDITGDVNTTGECNDFTISEVKGKVSLNCASVSQVHFENISGAVHIDSRNNQASADSLPGDLTLNDDELRITEARGAVTVKTHSRNVELNEIFGNTIVENRDGEISVELAGNYNLDARNEKGGVEVTLPPNASANVDGSAHNGEVSSDFLLKESGEENKSIQGNIGSGTAKIVLVARNGDLHIKKGSEIPPPPPVPSVSAANKAPKAPVPPAAPHLKAPEGVGVKPVTQ
jgi:DUF4097 and DUF4098 domain-containing protein YvlB